MEIVGLLVCFIFGLMLCIDTGLTLLGCGGRAEKGANKFHEWIGFVVGAALISIAIWLK